MQRVIVVSPDDTGISSARAKTDKLDSRTLASLVWKGELDAVWMPDERCRILRRRLGCPVRRSPRPIAEPPSQEAGDRDRQQQVE